MTNFLTFLCLLMSYLALGSCAFVEMRPWISQACERFSAKLELSHVFKSSAQSPTYYYDTSALRTRDDAGKFCADRGMLLVILRKKFEVNAISDALQQRGYGRDRFWVFAGNFYSYPPGGKQFEWVTGEGVTSDLWDYGEPNMREGEKACVFLFTGNRGFHDHFCSDKNYALCQMHDSDSKCF